MGTRADATIGAEIWRSGDGATWVPSVGGAPTPIGRQPEGFGDPQNQRIGELVVFNNELYAAARNDITGVQVWRSPDGITWTQVVGPLSTTPGGFGNANNTGIEEMQVAGGRLFAGTINAIDGAELWESSDGSVFTPLVTGGPGIGSLSCPSSSKPTQPCGDSRPIDHRIFVPWVPWEVACPILAEAESWTSLPST